MNTIKRDVYVLRNTIKIPIEVTKGTDAISFEFTVRDYNLPVTAAAVAYAYHKSMKKPNSVLCDVSGNVISFQPSANFFEAGNNELQIRVINEDKSLISFKEKVKCSDSMGFPDEEEEVDQSLIEQIIAQSGKESGERKAADEKERSERKTADETEKSERIAADAKEKSERQKEIATERARIDQLTKMGEGSTTGDAELADIRVGNEGATYSNAGNAVRSQTKDVPAMMDNLQSPYVDISLLEQGSLNNTGTEITSSKVLRSVEFHWNKNGKITAPSGYKIAIANYAMQSDESGQMLQVYQSATDYGGSQTSSKADGDTEFRRLLIKRSDGADINTEDLRGKITTNVPGLRAMDVIENLEKKIKEDLDDLYGVGNNIFDINSLIDGYMIYPQTGNAGYVGGAWHCTDFIPVKSGDVFYRSKVNSTQFGFYNEAKQWVDLRNTDGVATNGALDIPFIIPDGICYARFSIQKSTEGYETAYISKVNKYEPYGKYTKENTYATDEFLSETTIIPNLEDRISVLEEEISEKIVVSCWGDSLTAGAGATPIVIDGVHGATMPSTLAHLLDFDYPDDYSENVENAVLNFGVGGEDSRTILCRMGALLMYVNDITIPASGSVTINKIMCMDGKEIYPCRQDWGGQRWVFNECYIGGVKGKLTYDTSTSVYTFQRETVGAELVINRPTIITSAVQKRKDDVLIIEIGHNGGWDNDYEQLVNQYRIAIEHNGNDKYIIIGDTDGTAESRSEWEYALKTAFGKHFINMREYLSAYGLADRGLTPTEDDLAKMVVGEVPLQLKTDSTHLNSYGYYTEGEQVYKRGKELGYWI